MSLLKKKPKKAEAPPVVTKDTVLASESNPSLHTHTQFIEMVTRFESLEARLQSLEKKLDEHIEWVRKK